MKIDDLKQFIDKVLKFYKLYSKEAAMLVYGTILHESDGLKYRRQNTRIWKYSVHALGYSQVEKGTFEWLKRKYRSKFPHIRKIQFIDLAFDDEAAVLFCRLRYLADKAPIPATFLGQAAYYKRVYNGGGLGTAEKWLSNINKYDKIFQDEILNTDRQV